MSSKTEVNTYGTSIAGLLGIAFVVLKLCGVIDWSWWWVTLPFWGGLALVLAIAAVTFLVAGTLLGFASLRERRERNKKAV